MSVTAGSREEDVSRLRSEGARIGEHRIAVQLTDSCDLRVVESV